MENIFIYRFILSLFGEAPPGKLAGGIDITSGLKKGFRVKESIYQGITE